MDGVSSARSLTIAGLTKTTCGGALLGSKGTPVSTISMGHTLGAEARWNLPLTAHMVVCLQAVQRDVCELFQALLPHLQVSERLILTQDLELHLNSGMLTRVLLHPGMRRTLMGVLEQDRRHNTNNYNILRSMVRGISDNLVIHMTRLENNIPGVTTKDPDPDRELRLCSSSPEGLPEPEGGQHKQLPRGQGDSLHDHEPRHRIHLHRGRLQRHANQAQAQSAAAGTHGHTRPHLLILQNLFQILLKYLRFFHRGEIQRKLLRSDQEAQVVTMYFIYASDNSNNRFLVGIIAGRKANSTRRWLTLEEPDNDTFFIDGIPIITFYSVEDNQTSTWHIGTAHLVRNAQEGWTWIPDLTMMPERPLTFIRSYRLEYALEPTYVCIGFNPEGVPILMPGTAPTIAQHIVCPAQLMNIAEVTSKSSYNLAASMCRFSRRDFRDHRDLNNNQIQGDILGQQGTYDPEYAIQFEVGHFSDNPVGEEESKTTKEDRALSNTLMDQVTSEAATSFSYITVGEAIASFRRLSLEEGQDKDQHGTLKEFEAGQDRPKAKQLDPPEDGGGQ